MLKTLLHTHTQTFICLLRQETSRTICNGFEQVMNGIVLKNPILTDFT